MPLGGGIEETATTASRSPSERSAACRSRRARRAIWPRSAFVTTSTSGISMIPALRNCSASPRPGLDDDRDGVGRLGDLGLRLADADRLDHDDVEGGGERLGGGAGRGREPAEPLPGGGRADEQPAVGGSASIRARSPSSAPPERFDVGSTASTATVRPSARHARASALSSVDLPAPGRTGHADHMAGRLAAEPAGETSAAARRSSLARRGRAVLEQVERRRRARSGRRSREARAPSSAARAHAAAAAIPLRSATSATTSRMIRVSSKSFGV